MTYFTFKAYGSIFTAKAETGLELMGRANEELLWGNPEFKDGMWFEHGSDTFVWVEGNFFD